MTKQETVLEQIDEVQSELDKQPNNTELLNDLGVGYFLIGEYSKSVKALKKAVQLEPENESYLYNLGNSYAENEDFNESILQYLKALEINPGHLPSLNNLADSYERAGNSEKAFEIFTYVVKIAPNDPFPLFNLGNFLLRSNRHIEAVKCYEKVLEHNVQFTDAYYNIAWILSEAGATSDARSYLNKGLAISPDDNDLNQLMNKLSKKAD